MHTGFDRIVLCGDVWSVLIARAFHNACGTIHHVNRLIIAILEGMRTWHVTVRTDVEEHLAEERPASKHKNVPAWSNNVNFFVKVWLTTICNVQI